MLNVSTFWSAVLPLPSFLRTHSMDTIMAHISWIRCMRINRPLGLLFSGAKVHSVVPRAFRCVLQLVAHASPIAWAGKQLRWRLLITGADFNDCCVGISRVDKDATDSSYYFSAFGRAASKVVVRPTCSSLDVPVPALTTANTPYQGSRAPVCDPIYVAQVSFVKSLSTLDVALTQQLE